MFRRAATQPFLWHGVRGWDSPALANESREIDAGTFNGVRAAWIQDVCVITPETPPKLTYNPTQQTSAWLKRQARAIANNVYADVLAQAKVFEDKAHEQRWTRRPPRRSGAELDRVARRLFRRAVLRLSYGEIADEEVKDPLSAADRKRLEAKPPDESAIRSSVERWASDLSVTLP